MMFVLIDTFGLGANTHQEPPQVSHVLVQKLHGVRCFRTASSFAVELAPRLEEACWSHSKEEESSSSHYCKAVHSARCP